MKNAKIAIRIALYLIYFGVGTYLGIICENIYQLFVIISLCTITYLVADIHYNKKKR